MAEPGGPEGGGGGGGEGDDVVECVVEFDYIAELNDELTLRVSFFLIQKVSLLFNEFIVCPGW